MHNILTSFLSKWQLKERKAPKEQEIEIDPEEIEKAKAYKAIKKRRKLAIADSEDEESKGKEPDDTPLTQMSNGKPSFSITI